MSLYSYECEKCEVTVDKDYPFGKAKAEVECEICGGVARRIFVNAGFQFKGGSPSSNIKFKNQQIAKARKAASKTKKNWGSVAKLAKQ